MSADAATAAPPPRWAQRINKTGKNFAYALEPWRKLLPTKTITAAIAAGAGWLLDLHQLITWPW